MATYSPPSKSLWRSKTFWLNVVALAVAALTGVLDANLIQDHPQAVAWITGIIALLNMLLRTVTTKPIHLILLFLCLFMAGSAAAQTVKLLPEARYAAIGELLPKVEDERLLEVFQSPDTVWWDVEACPRAYQNFDSNGGFHWPGYNISGDALEARKGHGNGGNANSEFPWKFTGGTDRCGNNREVRFLLLPVRSDEATATSQRNSKKRWPIVHWRERLPHDQGGAALRWRYPVGTIVGELLIERGPGGREFVWQVRIREKEPGEWGADVFQPIADADELAQWVPGYQATVRQQRRVRDRHQRVLIDEVVNVSPLPAMQAEQVAKILEQETFESVLLTKWAPGVQCPTSDQPFHLVPGGYAGEVVEFRRSACNRCHYTTLQHVDQITFGRDWYGRVAGDDSVFSTPFITRGSISGNGFGGPTQLRSEFTAAGFIERFDESKHPRALYESIAEIERVVHAKR